MRADDRQKARLERMLHLPSRLDCGGKDPPRTSLVPDPDIVMRYHRSHIGIE